MTRYNSNIFKYSSQDYILIAQLTSDDININLDITDIEEVMYETKLNSLVVKGHIIYTDRFASVDKLLHRYYCFCTLLLAAGKRKHDGDIGVNGDDFKIDDKNKFTHDFIVTNISVLSRQANVIKYKIDIVSRNWFNCISNISYSNYGKEPEHVFDILKACLINSNLRIDGMTFDSVKTDVKLNYITKQNDNMFSVLDYLFSCLYYFNQKDDSVKFLVFDIYNNEYRLLDVKNPTTFTGTFETILSFFKTNNEALIQQEPTNIGSFMMGVGRDKVFQSMFKKNMWNYDFNNDIFFNVDMPNEAIVNYMNNKIDTDSNYEPKFQMLDMMLDLQQYQSGSYWNNHLDVYHDSAGIFQQNDAFVLNITGDVMRQAGAIMSIQLDRSINNLASDNKKELEDLKKKYKSYEGMWITSKVQTFIYPAVPSFRQQLAIFRNFQPTNAAAGLESTADSGKSPADQKPVKSSLSSSSSNSIASKIKMNNSVLKKLIKLLKSKLM